MKKAFFLILCVVAFYSCMPPQSSQQTVKQPPIVCLVDSFVTSHPDFMNNAITREKANTDWKKVVLDSLKNPNFLDGVNLTLIGINKTKKHGYIAHFRAVYNSDRYKNINNLDFDVLTYVSDSIAYTLVEKANYVICGDIIGPINFPTMRKLYEAPLNRMTDDYSITKCEYKSDKYDLQIANIMMDIKEFKRK